MAQGSFTSNIVAFDDVGAFNTVAPYSIDSAGATQLTLTSGKKSIIIQNTGSSIIWGGDSDVSPATNRGIAILPYVMLIFRSVSSNFSLYLKCAAGETSTLSVIET